MKVINVIVVKEFNKLDKRAAETQNSVKLKFPLKLQTFNSPGIDLIPVEVTQQDGRSLHTESHNLSLYALK